MASKEKDVYGEMRDATRAIGGHFQKFTDLVSGGIPDTYIRTKEFGGVWVEVKFVQIPKTPGWPLTVALSDLQRNWIKSEQEVGGHAGWMLCVKVSSREWRYYAGRDHKVTKIAQSDNHVIRKAGQVLDIQAILKMIVG